MRMLYRLAIKMKRKTVLSVYLVLSFLLLPISTIMMIHHMDTSDTLTKMQTGYFGQSQSTIAVKKDSISMKEICSLANGICNDVAVYQDVPNMKNTKKIFFNNRFANIPMLEGRFFNKNDFKEDNLVAVIGKNHKDQLISREGEHYIYIDNQQFKVIGVMGINEATNFDSYIFINGLTEVSSEGESIFTFDFFSSNGEEAINGIVNALAQNKDIETQIISVQNASFSNFLPQILYARWFILILFCDLLCIILVSLEWRNARKREVNIYRLVGAKPLDIVVSIISKYYLLAFSSLIISLSIIIPFNAYYINYILYAVCLFIPAVIVFAVSMTVSLFRSSIAEEIKS